jgi:hypothetical protein
VTETLQLDKVTIIELHDAPKLLVEWSPRWEEFVTSIRPAFARSGPRLAGETPYGVFPYRGMLASLLLEAFLLFVIMVLPRQIAQLRPYAVPKVQPYEVIYYSGDELPRTEDLGGAQSGATGRAGGQEAHHRTQTIHVSRGSSLAPKVVDAPDLKLPSSADAVANLLAFKSNPGPPPAEGLHSSLKAPSLPANVIAPAPTNVTRDQSRGSLTLNAVVPPAPNVSAAQSRTAPALNAQVVPPAPSVRSEHTLFAPRLDSTIIAPAPNVSRDRARAAPALNANVIGPASPSIARDQARSAPALNSSVIPPAPAAVGHEVAPSRVQMNNIAVVPPPVSAPERESSRTAKLNMPAPSVVAPPPSPDSARDLRRLESGGAADPSRSVIPPPPTPAGGSFVSNIIGKFFGTQDVVPPPPTVSSGSSSGTARNAAGGSGGSLATNVVPPPPAVGSGTARNGRGGPGGSLTANVVPPPPSVGGSGTAAGGSASGRSRGSSLGTSLGTSNVIPPPPSLTGTGSSNGSSAGAGNSGGSGNGTLLASNIVPPPPSVGSGPGLSGSGRKGYGLGGPGDVGSVLAPPKGEGGSNAGSGVVVSSQPGSKVGMPGSGGKGSLAMSPSGGDKPGLGGSGGGTGIGHGDGHGSGMTGENSGAGKTGTGRGSDPNAHGGISSTPGPGGAGSAPTGTPAVPGVDVRGGSTIVTLPSFGSDAGSDPNLPGRSSVKKQQGPAITIVATSRSGGAFDFYGKLPGDNYTVYVDTAIGTVVMQFAEVNPASHPQAGTLTGPQGLRTDLPADLSHARVVIKCQLDASGNPKNLQVLEPGPAAMTAKIMAALPSWKFRPAMRGQQPVEVNAILGFNIDTNDRY